MVSSAGNSAQLRLAWDLDPSVFYYDIYRQQTPGNTINMLWLGRVTCDAFYVNAMPMIGSETTTTLQLVAVSVDGTETLSSNATASFNWMQSAGLADFTLSSSSQFLSLYESDSVQNTISVVGVNGFAGTVALSISSALPAGVTASFSPTSTSGLSVLTLTTASS